ncbi:PIR protein [Plasmodium vivax]|uniref:VIR protein n=1 Tax=Plasmodium vivax TaxID=5855 RepID=A0A565A4P8_PLAVI|nr:PIR protein [Plasmodium vivax]
MSNDPLKPEYFDYNLYAKVKKKFKNSEYNQPDNERFKKITDKISNLPRELKWNDKIFTILHKYLAVYNGYELNVNQCCRYINFWLNREVRKKEYEKYRQDFNIFQKFSHEYAYEKQKHYNDSCKKYIHYMEEADYNRMKFLYDFFDMYNNLKSDDNRLRKEACENLISNTAIYNDAIDDYYVNHRDLYNKISHVKDDLIEKIINNPDKKCEQSKTFRIPQKLLEEEEEKKELARIAEERRKQEEEAVKQRKLAEAEIQRQQEKEAERQRTQRNQQNLVSQSGMPQMHTTHDAERERFQQGKPLRSVELGNSGETLNLETQERTNVLRPRLRLDYSGRLEDLKEPGLGLYEGQSEEIVHASGKEYTNPDGSFLGSLRLPSAITEVLGSVDPVPVVGVSGGMGALFLLFRYTPIGTYFRGGRGRVRRIRSGFSGHFPGGFPGYEEFYEGGFGPGPINISYRPELE